MLYVGLGIVYLFLLFFLGLRTIQNKHWILFAIGIFIPLVWIVGAMMPPKGMSRVDELYAQKEHSA